MQINGHPATIVTDHHGIVFLQNDHNFVGVAFQRFIDAIIDHFLGQVVGTRRFGIHTRPFSNGI